MPRNIFFEKQKVYVSLKWTAGPGPNAGVISFAHRNFAGHCYLNSKSTYSHGHDRTLAQEVAEQGFNLQQAPGFFAAPDNGGRRPVIGLGGGDRFLGYRTFKNLDEAIAYLNAVGLIVNPLDFSLEMHIRKTVKNRQA